MVQRDKAYYSSSAHYIMSEDTHLLFYDLRCDIVIC